MRTAVHSVWWWCDSRQMCKSGDEQILFGGSSNRVTTHDMRLGSSVSHPHFPFFHANEAKLPTKASRKALTGIVLLALHATLAQLQIDRSPSVPPLMTGNTRRHKIFALLLRQYSWRTRKRLIDPPPPRYHYGICELRGAFCRLERAGWESRALVRPNTQSIHGSNR